jgi:hypothetical protein
VVVGDLRVKQLGRIECGAKPSEILLPLGPFLLGYRLIMHHGMGRETPYVGDFVGFVVTGKSGYYVTK